MASSEVGGMRIVYGELDGGLVFLPQEDAVRLARLHEALRTSTTWGEFKTSVSPRCVRGYVGAAGRR